MTIQKSNLFISYARSDHDLVASVVEAIEKEIKARDVPIKLWMDVSNLQPGENWNSVLVDALEASVGFLFFVSPRSLKSDWIRHELQIAATSTGKLIIPIILHEVDIHDMPHHLKVRQWLDLSGELTQEKLYKGAKSIAEAVERFLELTPAPSPVLERDEAPSIAENIARELRASSEPEEEGDQSIQSVFVVHGHSDNALLELEHFLKSIDVKPVVLSRHEELAQSLFQKFMAVASKAKFAVILLGSDDYGASRRQYESVGVKDRALQFRARQNVILELGFFYGRLGWENVFVVYEEPEKVFPNFERPSDLDGVIFDNMKDPKWKTKLQTKLANSGFNVAETA